METMGPIFVVGCQRSGTTALAVMLDRHSRIAVTPETQFYHLFTRRIGSIRSRLSHEDLVSMAIEDPHISQLGIERHDIIRDFRTKDATDANLLTVILKSYAKKKKKVRTCEKSCDHLRYLDEILINHPDAKIVCIVRDGRDVALSTKKVPWGRKSSWHSICRRWKEFARHAMRFEQELSPDHFMIVRFEDLVVDTPRVLKDICRFIGEMFEEEQVKPSPDTSAIPKWEEEWKNKAKSGPDETRAESWRGHDNRHLVAMLTYTMKEELSLLGYDTTDASGIAWHNRAIWSIRYIPYSRFLYPMIKHPVHYLRRLLSD